MSKNFIVGLNHLFGKTALNDDTKAATNSTMAKNAQSQFVKLRIKSLLNWNGTQQNRQEDDNLFKEFLQSQGKVIYVTKLSLSFRADLELDFLCVF